MGADATSAGSEPSGDLSQSSSSLAAACNWFMQSISSNNGTPQTPSYYLSASDSEALNSVFKQISDKITDDRVLTELGTEAVIKDIVSPYFTVPDGEYKITVKTADYIGNNKFGEENEFTEADVTYADGVISVSNFDFKENWCGTIKESGKTDYHGKKLIIEFTVSPKPGFLGGNNVPTNGEESGVYKDGDAKDPLDAFPVPTVNVKIPDITVTANDKYVYLLNNPTEAELMEGVTIECGGVDITDPTKIADWQKAYVNIVGPQINKEFDSIYDGKYTVDVKVSPREDAEDESAGSAAENQSVTNEANIFVFKPEITWQDSEINLGDIADYEAQNRVGDVEWKHGETTPKNVSEPAKVIGKAPTLIYEYSPEAGAFTVDTPVKVTVKLDTADGTDITEHVKFVHNECDYSGCEWNDEYAEEGMSEYGKAHFIVHVKSFDLTITKTITSEQVDDQTFIFVITGPNGFSKEIVIGGFTNEEKTKSVTIKGLPAGQYTIKELTEWSWRYEVDGDRVKTVDQTDVSDGVAKVEFENKLTETKWLDGNAHCINEWKNNITIEKILRR